MDDRTLELVVRELVARVNEIQQGDRYTPKVILVVDGKPQVDEYLLWKLLTVVLKNQDLELRKQPQAKN